MSILSVVWLLAACSSGLVDADVRGTKLHEAMTSDELRSIFNVASHEHVPEYEIFNLESTASPDSEDSRLVEINALNKKLNLNLTRHSGISRRLSVFHASYQNGALVMERSAENEGLGELYQDQQTRSALLLRTDPDTGEVLMEGNVGDDLVITPLHSSVLPAAGYEDEEAHHLHRGGRSAALSPQDVVAVESQDYSGSPEGLQLGEGTALGQEYAFRSGRALEENIPRAAKYQEGDVVYDVILPLLDALSRPVDTEEGDHLQRGSRSEQLRPQDRVAVAQEDHFGSPELQLGEGSVLAGGSAFGSARSAARTKKVTAAKSGYAAAKGFRVLRRLRRAAAEGAGPLHVAYRRKSSSGSRSFVLPDGDSIVTGEHRLRTRNPLFRAPESVYPEILTFIDYDTFLMHGKDLGRLQRYYLSFWNAVDLYYSVISSPKIKINLVSLVLEKKRGTLSFMNHPRVGKPPGSVDGLAVFEDFTEFLYNSTSLFPSYDIAAYITKSYLSQDQHEEPTLGADVGIAGIGGACKSDHKLQAADSAIIIQDSSFDGVMNAVHEVAHVLGAVHDGQPTTRLLAGPGAVRCPAVQGFIMSPQQTNTLNHFRWSRCSVAQMQHFLSRPQAMCLHNRPEVLHSRTDFPAPGEILSLDMQCRRVGAAGLCTTAESTCVTVLCERSDGYCAPRLSAAEGTPCGIGKSCSGGQCLPVLESKLPANKYFRRE